MRGMVSLSGVCTCVGGEVTCQIVIIRLVCRKVIRMSRKLSPMYKLYKWQVIYLRGSKFCPNYRSDIFFRMAQKQITDIVFYPVSIKRPELPLYGLVRAELSVQHLILE